MNQRFVNFFLISIQQAECLKISSHKLKMILLKNSLSVVKQEHKSLGVCKLWECLLPIMRCKKICDTRISCSEQIHQPTKTNEQVSSKNEELLLKETEFLRKLLKGKEDKYNVIVEDNLFLKRNKCITRKTNRHQKNKLLNALNM